MTMATGFAHIACINIFVNLSIYISLDESTEKIYSMVLTQLCMRKSKKWKFQANKAIVYKITTKQRNTETKVKTNERNELKKNLNLCQCEYCEK